MKRLLLAAVAILLWAAPAFAVSIWGQRPGDTFLVNKASWALMDAYLTPNGFAQIGPVASEATPPAYRVGVCYLVARPDGYRFLGTPFEVWPRGIRQLRVDSLGVRVDSALIVPRLGPPSGAGSGGAIRIVDGAKFPLTAAGIIAAYDDLPSTGGTVGIPAGDYTFGATDSLVLAKPVDMWGFGGWQNTRFIKSSSNTTVTVRSNHGVNQGIKFHGIGIKGATGAETGKGLYVVATSLADIRDVRVGDIADSAVVIREVWDSSIDLFVESCGSATDTLRGAFYCTGSAVGASNNSDALRLRLHIEACNGVHAIFDNGGGAKVTDGIDLWMKVHGKETAAAPNVPLVIFGAGVNTLRWTGGLCAWGRGPQVYVLGQYNSISGVDFSGNGADPTAVTYNIRFGVNGNRNLVTGCTWSPPSVSGGFVTCDNPSTQNQIVNPHMGGLGGRAILTDNDSSKRNHYDYVNPDDAFRYMGPMYPLRVVVLDSLRVNRTSEFVGDVSITNDRWLLLNNGGRIRFKDTGGSYQNVVFTSGSDLVKIKPLATGSAVRIQNFLDNTTNLEVADNGKTTALTMIADSTRSNSGLFVGGQKVNKILRASATLDFDLTAVTCQDLTITVTGSALNDEVVLGVPNGSVTSGVDYTAWVSASNTVTVRACTFIAAQNPASGTFKVTVIQ